MGMQAVILGSGSAVPDPVRGNPSQAVVVGETILLFDCGERTTVNLTGAGINPLNVDYLFFTHLHVRLRLFCDDHLELWPKKTGKSLWASRDTTYV